MLLASVPNVSLGPQDDALDRVLAELEAAASPVCQLLDVHTDRDHRRTVLTLAGSPTGVLGCLTRLQASLLEHASLVDHAGVHPRVGMLDVVPFVSIEGSRRQALHVAERFAKRSAEHGVPVYSYGQASRGPLARELSTIRARVREAPLGEQAPLAPDAGPAQLHPTQGATCVGVRDPLVAYNVLLDTRQLDIGRSVAREIRASSGGLPGVQALAFALASRGDRIQVSTNITDVARREIADVYRRVREEANDQGTAVVTGELVGLAPAASLPEQPAAIGLDEMPRSLEEVLGDHGFAVADVR